MDAFFDENSYMNHRELNKVIHKDEKTIDYYKKEIGNDENWKLETLKSETWAL